MNGAPLKDLRLEKYSSLLRPRGLPACPVALCDAAGALLWAPSEADGQQVARALGLLSEAGFEWEPEGGTRCVELASPEALFCHPVVSGTQAVAWLALLVREVKHRDSAAARDAIRDTLQDVAACIAEEYRLNEELQDVSDELAERYEELNLLYSLRKESLDEGERVVHGFLHGFAELMSVDVAAFVTAGRTSIIHATRLTEPIENLDLVLVALRGDVFRFVQASRKPLVLNATDDPRRAFILTNMPFKLLACPVGGEKSVDRMLVLLRHSRQPDFSNSDRNLARVVAEQVGLVIRNHAMVERLKRFGEQTVAALVEALEAKDPYTRGHSERVQLISLELGQAVGFQPPELEDLFWGAIFHDVGKLGVPDAILCKPGRLTSDEYDFVKIHPERSYDILKHIEYLRKNALDGARHHHERFDGNGYPHGLVGKSIPVHARIIAVADAYDAITSSRSYRAGRGHDEAMRIIHEAAGTQLDPRVVGVLEELCTGGARWPKGTAREGPEPDA